MSKNSEHLKWLYDRMANIHDESELVDYMVRFRHIIRKTQMVEEFLKEEKDDK